MSDNASGAARPFSSDFRPITPRRGSDRACDNTTPMPGPTKGARPPAAMLDVANAQPNCPVRGQRPTIENVMRLSFYHSWAGDGDGTVVGSGVKPQQTTRRRSNVGVFREHPRPYSFRDGLRLPQQCGLIQ